MPPAWWRSPRLYKTITLTPVLFIGYVILLNVSPDPPAVQQAQIRNREQKQRRRDEAYVRELERRIDENPAAYGLQWPEDEMDSINEDGGSQGRK